MSHQNNNNTRKMDVYSRQILNFVCFPQFPIPNSFKYIWRYKYILILNEVKQ